jgi:hypothetical protein
VNDIISDGVTPCNMPADLNLTSIETCPGSTCLVINNIIIEMGDIIPLVEAPGVLMLSARGPEPCPCNEGSVCSINGRRLAHLYPFLCHRGIFLGVRIRAKKTALMQTRA